MCLSQCYIDFLLYLQYQEGFSNWTILSISVADEDDLPARFSTYEYQAFVREDAAVVRLMHKAVHCLDEFTRNKSSDGHVL